MYCFGFAALLLMLNAINITQEEGDNGNPFNTLLDKPSSPLKPSSISKSFLAFPVLVRVLNAFPPTGEEGSEVSVVLEEDEVEGVEYGREVVKQTMMHAKEDFVIYFNNPTKGALMEHAVYGYIDGEVGRDEEVLVIVRRGKADPQKPEYDIKHFPTQSSKNSSRVYAYNAIWSTTTTLGGLNFYGVNRDTGELVTLATGLAMGEGQDITLPPGTVMAVKASHVAIESSDLFNLVQTTASIPAVHTFAGRRHYIIAYGDQNGYSSTRAILLEPVGVTGAIGSANPSLCGHVAVFVTGGLMLLLTLGHIQ